MYNERIKIRYIEEKETSTVLPKEYLQRLFLKTEILENEYEKDLCNFNYFELLELIKSQNSTSFESLTVFVSHISLYIDWCIQNNMVFDFQNHCSEISRETVRDLVNNVSMDKRILNRKDVLEIISKCQNPCDQFIILALFEGIQGKDFCEIRNIKYNDIKGNEITLCTNRTVALSDKLVDLAYQSDNELTYYTENKKIPLKENGFVIKTSPNAFKEDDEFQAGRRIYNKVRRALMKMDEVDGIPLTKFIKPNGIFESGKLYFIRNHAKKMNISCIEYVNNCFDEIIKQYGNFDKNSYVFKYQRYLK